MKKILLSVFCFAALLTSCDLSKEVDIELPKYAAQPVVECYLIPGEPYRLLLTKSNSFFDPFTFDDPVKYFQSISMSGAQVRILTGQDTITLQENLHADIASRKIFNYTSDAIVPADHNNVFRLQIITPEGKDIHAVTLIPRPVPIDSVITEWEEGGKMLARQLIYTTDNPAEANFYRRMIHFGSLDSTEQDYVIDDKIFTSEKQAYGTAYQFEVGDTVIHTHLNITREYFQFVSSYQSSNANPFTQPGVIKSNVTGTAAPLGIFTGFSMVRDSTYIRR